MLLQHHKAPGSSTIFRRAGSLAIDIYRITPEISPEMLEELADSRGMMKLGNGTYVLELKYGKHRYHIVNAFHPQQLRRFYNKLNTIIVLECLSNCVYSEITDNVIGACNPAKAKKGSMRRYIYKNARSLNIGDICTAKNGFHVSPSPLEGMFGVMRYCRPRRVLLRFEETNLGRRLLEAGLDKASIANLGLNPLHEHCNNVIPIFDTAEGLNASEIIPYCCWLKRALPHPS